jgi:D-beta-D-heptose 7-phosphate kinase/D-beta-D-heptose 1-phosphate adenosyltransferase
MTLEELVDELKKQHVLVVGDAIEDHYLFGRVERVCPEAPVPVFLLERAEVRAGGAEHTAQQVEALGEMSALFGWPKSVKLRYMVGSHMLLRHDADEKPSMTSEEIIAAFNKMTKEDGDFKPITAIILSDYGKGMLDEKMCQFFIGYAKARHVPVFVDPKGSDWSKYRGADWICPNEAEWASRVADTCTAQVLRKRGAKGLQIGDTEFHSTAQSVFDVTGAGDTVVAVFAMAIAAGADPGSAAQLANIAAGCTVGQVGTVSISHELLKRLAKLHDAEIAQKQPTGRKLN